MAKARAKKSPPAKKPARHAAASAKKTKGKAAASVPASSALLLAIPKVHLLQFAATGRALLLARAKSSDTLVTLFDLESRSESPPLKALAKCSAIALSADNRHLAVGTSSGIIAVQSTQTGKTLWKTKAGGEPVRQLLFSLDGSLLFAAAEPAEKGDAWLRAHKTATGELDPTFEPVAGARCCHLALSPDGLFLAHSEIRSHSILIWHLPTRQMGACLRLPRERGAIVDLAFGSGVKHLLAAQKHQLSMWNAESGTRELAVDASQFTGLAPLPAPGILAVTRMEEEKPVLEIRGAQTLHLRRTIRLPEIGRLAASPDGTLLALTIPGKNCWLWKAERF